MNHFCHIPNPRKIGHTEFEIGLTETELPIFCNHLTSYRSNRVFTIGLTDSGMFLFFLKSVQPSFLFRSHRKLQRSYQIHFRSHRDGIFGPTENPNVHYIRTFGLTEFSLRSHRDWSNVCVTVGFCVEAIYTPPPPLHSRGEPSESTTTSTIHFLRSEPPTLVLRSSHSIPTI